MMNHLVFRFFCLFSVFVSLTFATTDDLFVTGYPRSKYSKYRAKAYITTTERSSDVSQDGNEETTQQSDLELHYECGAQTAENHPWIAVLEHTDPFDKSTRKTLSKGVLIAPQYVLTTVSSIHNSHPFWVVSGVR